MLAAKAALACRADALAESIESAVKDKKLDKSMKTKLEALNNGMLGVEGRAKVEARLRMLEGKSAICLYSLLFDKIKRPFHSGPEKLKKSRQKNLSNQIK